MQTDGQMSGFDKRMDTFTRVAELTPLQQSFIDLLLKGYEPLRAAEAMGYEGIEAFKTARSLIRSPQVQVRMMGEAGADLRTTGVAKAVKTLIDLVDKPGATDKTRLEAAKTLLDRAGFGPSTYAQPKEPDGEKPLSEMSLGELRDAVQRLERDLSARAKPVDVIDGEPVSEPDASEMLS
jgi:hypothetical protein